MVALGFDSGHLVGTGDVYHAVKLVCFLRLGVLVVGERGAAEHEPVLAPHVGLHVLSHQQPALAHDGRLFQGLASVLVLGYL